MPRATSAGGCRAKAPCGGRCCCEGSVKHTLHICKEPDCMCHSRERYEERKGTEQNDA